MSGLNGDLYNGTISKMAGKINKLDPNQVREAIRLVQTEFEKDQKDISNIHLQDSNLDIPQVKLEKQKEESKEEDLER